MLTGIADWAGRSMTRTKLHPAYEHAPVRQRRDQTAANSGKQPGDPRRAAKVMCQIAEDSDPPLRILLGNAAADLGYKKLETYKQSIDKWEKASRSCDFPKEEQ